MAPSLRPLANETRATRWRSPMMRRPIKYDVPLFGDPSLSPSLPHSPPSLFLSNRCNAERFTGRTAIAGNNGGGSKERDFDLGRRHHFRRNGDGPREAVRRRERERGGEDKAGRGGPK